MNSIGSLLNDSEKKLIKSNIVIDSREVDLIAEKLVSRWSSPKWHDFYCLVANHIPQHRIWELAEIADEKGTRSKGGYFNALACKEMGYRPKDTNV
jgi:hypothetical protein